jgi:hypothetical protein
MGEPTKAADAGSTLPMEAFSAFYKLDFVDLRMTVPAQKSNKPHTAILKGVSGYCRGSCLTAIMGASGAGESIEDSSNDYLPYKSHATLCVCANW